MLLTTRPKLTVSTFYMPTANGVLFRNQDDSLELRGKTLFHWIEKLAPYLNGEYTLAEILQGLPPDKQAWVAQLLEILQTRHFLKDVSQDRPHTLSQEEKAAYASAIAFIDAFQESAPYRFERFRNRRMLVIGSGMTCTTLVHALLDCGVRQLTVLTTEECETPTSRYQEYRSLFSKRDPRQSLTEIAAPEWNNEAAVSAALAPFDTILHISDRPMFARSLLLNQYSVAGKKLLAQAIVVDTHAWIGPLVDGKTHACWECAWLRYQSHPSQIPLANPSTAVSVGRGGRSPLSSHAHRSPIRLPCDQVGERPPGSAADTVGQQYPSHVQSPVLFQDDPTTAISWALALPTAALVANLLSFEVFKYCTEAGPQNITESLLDVDLATLSLQQHSFLRHPLCATCSTPVKPTSAAFLDRVQDLEQRQPLDPDYFPKQMAFCFADQFGLFSPFDNSGYAKSPLRFCQATMSTPPGLAVPEEPLLLTEAGQSFYRARRHLARRACEVYAAHMVDSRRFVTTEEAQQIGHQAHKVDPTLFLEGGENLTNAKEWTWALQIQSREVCLIPASLVFPVLSQRRLRREIGPGVASGMDWAEAICRALLNWCQQITLSQIGSSKKPYPQIDLDMTSLQVEGPRQRRLLAYAQKIVKVYDVTGPLQIPTFAFCFADMTVTYSTHIDATQALRTGLEQVVQQYQALKDHELDLLAPVPILPVELRGEKAALASYAGPSAWPARQQWLLARLQENNWQAFAVPLDHDPACTNFFPSIVHVLLARRQDEHQA